MPGVRDARPRSNERASGPTEEVAVEARYAESADFYARGRLPYPGSMEQALVSAVGTGGMAVDVGCGPGTLAARLAAHFDEVVGVDQELSMVRHAQRVRRPEHHVHFVCAAAEHLPFDQARFRVAVIGQAFHWFDQEAAAHAVNRILQPGGFCVVIYGWTLSGDPVPGSPYPVPPYALLTRLLASASSMRDGATVPDPPALTTPGDETDAMLAAGFRGLPPVPAAGGEPVITTADDLIARCLSRSNGAPYRRGRLFEQFSTAASSLLHTASPNGLFAEQLRDAQLNLWQKDH
jgi:SAM-dependent methyltransferase